jgi:hypothetical protein
MDIPKLPSHMGEVRPLSAFTAATACVVTVPRRVLCAAARHAVSRGRAAAEGRRGCVCLLPGQQVCRRARWRSCCRRGSTVGKVRCMSSCFPRVPIGVSVSGFVFAVVVVVVCVWVGISVLLERMGDGWILLSLLLQRSAALDAPRRCDGPQVHQGSHRGARSRRVVLPGAARSQRTASACAQPRCGRHGRGAQAAG